MSDASIISYLAESIRVQEATKALRQNVGVNLEWAERIVAQHTAGTFCGGVYAVKLAHAALNERAALTQLPGADK